MLDSMLEVLPDQATVLGELRDLLPRLRQAVLAAKSRMESNPVENRALHCSTTTAGEMVDYMVAEAQLLFTSDPRVFFKKDEETWLVADQRYDVRFKKLSSCGLPQNTATSRQRRITSQRPLPGFHLMRLNVGWGEDQAGEFQVLASFNIGFGVVGWCVEIREDGVYSLVGNPLLPFADGLPMVRPPANPYDLSDPDEPEAPRRRVRPRITPLPEAGDAPPRRVRPAGPETPPLRDERQVPVRKSDE